MAAGLALLLGLVAALEEVTWAHRASSSSPCIWAVPGAVIPNGSSVRIFCRVPPGVTALRLYHGEPGGRWHERLPEGAQDVVNFSLPKVTQLDAGKYFCDYWKQRSWTGQTELLELVVTGIYKDQPSLTAHPSAQTVPGGNLTLQCQPVSRYDTYILCRGGGDSFPQDCSPQSHSSFLISFVSLDQAGPYTCYATQSISPHLWTLPSNPLLLSVKLSLDVSTAIVASAAAAFLLLVLLLLLLLLCLRRRRGKRSMSRGAAYDGTKGQMRHESSSPPVLIHGESEDHDAQGAEPEAARQRDTLVPLAEAPQEVTYAQLHPVRPRAGVAPLLSQDPEACVYATLTLS
ncbi:leukocyte immunoglobulin-like receptor subfamily B member 4 isoform X2 [Octodon degus]|uniref:Leukocyte immunoglobulin-like receptor subfamily B member 4 isoform X2 n=1 Tax=Octodon degus TaxID=10160 RepID=A0A6P6DUQ3_OCTDE|nr:leukocyte immunoglobulin-like receptor subfamily B member 4 isoform X2 [Octodon degus]